MSFCSRAAPAFTLSKSSRRGPSFSSRLHWADTVGWPRGYLSCRTYANQSIVEVGGYITRILAHNDTDSQLIYIMQIILLLVAPGLYAASIYMTLGRIILYTDAVHLSPIKRTLMTKIFVCGDVISFFVQLGGEIHYPSFAPV